MKKTKRILALAGAVLLILLYLSTLIFALIDSPVTNDLFMASAAATILIPVLLYGLQLFYRLRNNSKDDSDNHTPKTKL